MSDLRVYSKQLSPQRATDDTWVALRGTRDGSPIVCPWFQALALEGRVFQAQGPEAVSIDVTGMTLLALASFGDDDATIYADIPDGTAVLPLEAFWNFVVTGGAIANAFGLLSDTLLGTGGTETACTIRAYHRGVPVSSVATAAHTATSETDHITGAEVQLFRYATQADLDAAVGYNERNLWNAVTAGVAPIGVDGASFSVDMVQTTSGTGFAHIVWAELPEAAVS